VTSQWGRLANTTSATQSKLTSITSHLGQMGWLMPVITATREAETRKIVAQGQPQFHKTPSQPTQLGVGTVAHTCHPSYLGKHKKEGCSPEWPGCVITHLIVCMFDIM
jgi:hypothetical protein